MVRELSRRSFATLVGGVGAASVAAGAGTYSLFTDEERAEGTLQAADDFPEPVRINCGGSQYTTGDGRTFAADQYNVGGSVYSETDPIDNTTEDTLYQTERYGNDGATGEDFRYGIPVTDGTYDVRIHLAEIFWGGNGNGGGAGSRVFDISIEGTLLLDGYDLYDDVGHDYATVAVAQDVSVADGALNVVGTASQDNAKISAIEVVPVGGPPPGPTYETTDTTPAQSATFDTTTLDIEAAGADVWQNDDEYGAIYRPDVSGDFTATVTVDSQQAVHQWSKAGIMVANDVTNGGGSIGDVFMAVTPGNGYQSMFDDDEDGYIDVSPDDGSTSQYPSQLRIEKAGTTFTCSYSIDGGSSWIQLASRTVPTANATQDVALAVTSHQAGTTSTVEFSNFTVS